MSSSQHDWKVLAIGHGHHLVKEAQEYINSLGYKNVLVINVDNDQESDERLLNTLKEKDYDAITIGGYVNLYNFERYTASKSTSDHSSNEREQTFYWFNRIINLVHENSPKIKIVLVKDPFDIHNGLQRVLANQKK